jgi:hypothetical protein
MDRPLIAVIFARSSHTAKQQTRVHPTFRKRQLSLRDCIRFCAARDTELRTFCFSFSANGVTVDSIDQADAPRMAGAGEAGGTLTGNATRNRHLREAAQMAGFAWFARGHSGEQQAGLRVGSGGNAKLPASVVVSGLVCLRRATI